MSASPLHPQCPVQSQAQKWGEDFVRTEPGWDWELPGVELGLENPRKELEAETPPSVMGGGGCEVSETGLKAGGGSSLPKSPRVAHASHYHK